MTVDEKGEEMICGLTADERGALRRELARLPQIPPPRAVWERVREQAEAEGLLRRRHAGRALRLGGAGLAAAAVLAFLIVPGLDETRAPSQTVPAPGPVTNEVPLTALQALMVESQQLENDLRAMPDEPRVLRVGTAATISELEDRIAAIDFQLNDPSVRMAADDTELFWRERVRLMKLLVQLRYAQAQRAGY